MRTSSRPGFSAQWTRTFGKGLQLPGKAAEFGAGALRDAAFLAEFGGQERDDAIFFNDSVLEVGTDTTVGYGLVVVFQFL